MREIIAVFQDCVLCGVKGRKTIAEYAEKGVSIRKVGFTTEEGGRLIHEAVMEHGIGSLPFYVAGGKFSSSLEELIKESQERKAPKKKSNKSKKDAVENGVDSEV